MLKPILKFFGVYKYGLIAAALIALIAWHYGSVYFAKQEGKTEQQATINAANNAVITKQVITNEKINTDVNNTDVNQLRDGLLEHAPAARSVLPESTCPDRLQPGGDSEHGRANDSGCNKTQESIPGTYQRLCRVSGCENGCYSISYDNEFGLVGVCDDG